MESVFAAAADEEPDVIVRRGTRVAGLLAGPSVARGTPHVAGVVTTGGEELRADLVVDAMGRRTPASEWLVRLGTGRPETQAEDCGFVYYTRYFAGPQLPSLRAAPLTPMGTSRC